MLLLGDAVAVGAAALLALWTWSITAGFPYDWQFLGEHREWFLAVPLWLVLLAPTRHSGSALDARQSVRGVIRAGTTMLLIYLAVFFSAGGERLPRLVAVYLLWDATLLVIAWRVMALWSFMRAPFSRRVLVAGSGQPLETALQLLDEPTFRDASVIGIASNLESVASDRFPRVGPLDEVDSIARRLQVTDVIVALDSRADEIDDQWVQRLLRCQENGTRVVRLAQLYEDTLARVPVEHVGSSWLLTNFFDVARSREASPLAKRLFDLAVAALLCVAGSILLPIIALAIVALSGRPVLYRQERLGRGGTPFQIIKFRTMQLDAEPDGPQWSLPNDARVTPIGRLLRRTRLDELPNLIAVLKGDMSMVGPRPERPSFVERLEREVPLYRARLLAAPGLTGWAQVNWPYGDSVRDATIKLEYDLYYIKHQSIWFDAMILLRTVRTMLSLEGR